MVDALEHCLRGFDVLLAGADLEQCALEPSNFVYFACFGLCNDESILVDRNRFNSCSFCSRGFDPDEGIWEVAEGTGFSLGVVSCASVCGVFCDSV